MTADFRFKATLLALAAVCALPGTAPAQQIPMPSVSVFGVADGALLLQTSRSTDGNTALGTHLSVGSAWQASRFGIRGKMDLSDDVKIIYDMASTLNLNNGSFLNPSRLFDRNLYVGVASSTYGTLMVGRQVTPVTESLWTTDPLRANNGATNLNVRLAYLAGPGDLIMKNFGTDPGKNSGGSGNDRQSNAVKYVYGKSGFLGMAMYATGAHAGDLQKESSFGALLGYDVGPLKLRAAYTGFRDVQNTAFNAYTGGVVFKPVDVLTIRATYSQNQVEAINNPTTPPIAYNQLKTQVWSGGATWAAAKGLDVTFAYYGAQRSQSGVNSLRADKFYVVPEYYLAKNLILYAIFDYEAFNTGGSALDTGTPLDPNASSSFFAASGLSLTF